MQKKILVVDDDTAIVESLKILLQVKGYAVDTASDGQEAIEKATAGSPDCIILDMLLPRKDGAQVYRELRQNPATAAIPVLFLSSFSEKPDPIPGDETIPEDRFLPKPIDPKSILEKVAALVGN